MPILTQKTPKINILKTLKNNLDVLPKIDLEMTYHILSCGQFNLIDIIQHVAESIGVCNIDLAVWTAAETNLKKAELFVKSNRVKNMRWIIDPSFRSRQPQYVATLEQLFSSSSIRTIPTHAKFIILYNENFNVVIQTSMNLNQNKRLESFTITESKELCNFYKEFVEDVFEKIQPEGNFSTQNAQTLVSIFDEKNEDAEFNFDIKKSQFNF